MQRYLIFMGILSERSTWLNKILTKNKWRSRNLENFPRYNKICIFNSDYKMRKTCQEVKAVFKIKVLYQRCGCSRKSSRSIVYSKFNLDLLQTKNWKFQFEWNFILLVLHYLKAIHQRFRALPNSLVLLSNVKRKWKNGI